MLNNYFNALSRPRHGIIGHRGAAGQAPENTFAAFSAAANRGINWVEFDVQPCKSGEWVVLHDRTLSRTTNGQGAVTDWLYRDLISLEAGAWFDPRFSGEKIPSLKETLEYLSQRDLHPNIEIKPFFSDIALNMQSFLQTLKHWPAARPLPLISSFDLSVLTTLQALAPHLPLGYLVEAFTPTALQKALEAGFTALHIPDTGENLPLNRLSKKIPILMYTVNQPSRIQTLLQQGITAVFSDLTFSNPLPFVENPEIKSYGK